jgi:hypothetical protein
MDNKNRDSQERFTSRRTETYKKLLDKLPSDVQKACQDAFINWKKDPASLHMKPLTQLSGEAYSAEINRRYRALGFKTKDEKGKTGYVWFWVGSHEDYNKVIANQAVTSQIKKMRNRIEDKDDITPPAPKPR